MTKCENRFDTCQGWSSWTHFRCCTAPCTSDISDAEVERGQCTESLRMMLPDDQMKNNANQNDQQVALRELLKIVK